MTPADAPIPAGPLRSSAAADLVTERAPIVVAVVSLGIGAALTIAPSRAAALLALPDDRRFARGLGGTDLVLAVALVRARPRWPWMALRATLNAFLVRSYVSHGARGPALALGLLTVVDGSIAIALRRRRR